MGKLVEDQQTMVDDLDTGTRLFPKPPNFFTHIHTTSIVFSSTMPRKAATSSDEHAAEPRRSTRIKELPKEEPAPKKAPAKPRVKKADKEGAEKEEKPKAAPKSKKRKADDEPNGASEKEDAPPAKKVRYLINYIRNITSKV